MPAPPLPESPQTSARSIWWAPLLVLLLSLLVGGSLLAYLARLAQRSDRAAFEGEVARTLDTVRERVETTVTLLQSASGLFAASQDVSPAEFTAYVSQLRLRERYPGVQGIGFSQRIPAGQEQAELQRLRAYWGPDFGFWPAQRRGERHAIVFLEPQDERNRAALGFDMTEEPVRRAAMEAARDSGQARASGAVTLVQEIGPQKQAGLLIYVPLYRGGVAPGDVAARRAALLGFIYAPLRVGDLLGGVRGTGPKRIEYELYDGVPPGVATLMRDTRAQASASPRFVTERRLEVEGRPWLMRFSSHADFEASSQRHLLPWFVLLVLAASALAAGITYVQAREHRLTLRWARAQRRNEAALKASEERERLRSQRLQRLAAATPALTGATSREAVLQALQQQSRQLLDAPSASLLDAPHGGGQASPPGGLLLNLGEPAAAGEADAFERGATQPVLQLAPRPGQPYTDDERLLLEQLGRIASVALRNAGLLEVLRENDRRKDEFLAVLAHELRNPLAPLRTSLEILRRLPQGEAGRRARDVAERQTAHMVRLVDDLLDVSRISHGTIVLRRRRLALAEVVAQAVETARPALDARAHRLRIDPVDPALQVDGDDTRLAQVFANLLVNAANYTPAGGDIELFARRDGEAVEVTVRDNGVGIDPALLGEIFEPFMQVDRSSERAGGLGIGLMLVRRLTELHGGTVRAASGGSGLGSAFTVRLPLASEARPPQAASGPGASSAAEGAPGTHRILVVDDNRDAAESLAAWLSMDGHEVTLAHDGGHALHAAQDVQPEVVLLDLGLPDLDGYEVARRLRAAPHGSDVHLVAVTGWGQDEDRRRTREAGFDLHLVKPVDLQALADYLHRLWRG